MSKLDQEFKKRFGEEKFPESLKQKGWEKASAMLDKAMPVAQPSLWDKVSLPGKLALFSGLGIVAVSVWLIVDKNSVTQENSTDTVNEQIEEIHVLPESHQITTPAEDAEAVVKDNEQNIANTYDLTEPDFKNNESESRKKSIEAENFISTPVSTKNEGLKGGKINSTNAENTNVGTSVADNFSVKTDEDQIDKGIELTDNNAGNAIDPSRESEPDITITNDEKNIAEGERIVQNEEPSEQVTSQNKVSRTANENFAALVDKTGSKSESESNAETSSEQNATIEQKTEAEEEEKPLVTEEAKTPITPVKDDISGIKKEEKLDSEHLAFTDLNKELTGLGSQSSYKTFASQRFSLESWVGYSFVDKIIDADKPAYKDQREAQEIPIWKLSSGFAIDYFLNRNWTAGLGIGYSEYGEQVNYISPLIGDSSWIDGRFNSPSEFSSVTNIDSVRVIDSINKGHWNYMVYYQKKLNDSIDVANGETYWRYIDIPLTVGYRFGKGFVRPWVKTGVIIGIPLINNVRYLDPVKYNRLEVEGAAANYQPSLQYSLQFQMGVDVKLARNFSFRLNANSAMQLNPSYQSEKIRQRYYRIGASAGVAYNF